MDTSRYDDAALLRLVAQSDHEALAVLYDRYSRLVYSLALQVVGDSAAAEEITQDVFTSVWQKAASYRAEQSKFSTWLSSITRHRAIDVLRWRSVRVEGHSEPWAEIEDGELPHPASTHEQAELSMLQQQVRRAVASLPPEQQKALALAYFKGYSHSEIAEALNEPLGTVKTRIRTAMQKIRQLLEDEINPVMRD